MSVSSREFARKVLNGAIYGSSQLSDINWLDEYVVKVLLNAYEQRESKPEHLPLLKEDFLIPSMPDEIAKVRAELEAFLKSSVKAKLISKAKLSFPVLVKKQEFQNLDVQVKLKLLEVISLYKRISNIDKEISLYSDSQFSRNKAALNNRVSDLINQLKSFEEIVSMSAVKVAFNLESLSSDTIVKRTINKVIRDSMLLSGCLEKQLISVADYPKLYSSIKSLTSLNYTSVAPRISKTVVEDNEKNLSLGTTFAKGQLTSIVPVEQDVMDNYSLLWRLKDDIIDANKKGSLISELNNSSLLQALAIRFEKAPTTGFEQIANDKTLFDKARKEVESGPYKDLLLDTMAKIERAFFEEQLSTQLRQEITQKVAIANFLVSEANISIFSSNKLLCTYYCFFLCNSIRNFQQQYCNLSSADPYVVIRADNNDETVLEMKRKMFINWITLVDAINMIVEV